MADVKVPYPEVGLAAFEKLDDYEAGFLLSGSWPILSPGYPLPVPADAEYKQFLVVALVAGEIVPATKAGPKPVGVLTQQVTGNADGTTTVPVFFSGCFDPAALIWDASFVTLEDKKAAFFGASSPTDVLIRERG